MRKNPLLVLSVLLTLAVPVCAQQSTPDTNPPKHDFGFNSTFALSTILNSDAQPVALMYKTSRASNKALRFGISGNVSQYVHVDNKTANAVTNTSSSYVLISVGKEFQHTVNRWTWYGGGDLQPLFASSTSKTYTGNDVVATTKTRKPGVNVRPFLGLRYNFNEHLYVAAEAAVSLGYQITDTKTDNQGTSSHSKQSVFTTNTISASGLFFFYRF